MEKREKPKNAAIRLHSILSGLKQIPGTNPCASSFGGILEVPGSNQMLLLDRVGRVNALMRRAREQTLALDAPEHYLEWFQPIQNVFFNLNLGATLAEAFPRNFGTTAILRDHALRALRRTGTG